MAALFTLLLGAAAVLLGYFLYDFGKQNFLRETEAVLDSEIAHILELTAEQLVSERTAYVAKKYADKHHALYLYMDASGQRLAGSLPSIPNEVSVLKEGILVFETAQSNKPQQIAAKIHTFADGSRILVGRNIEEITRSYARLQWFAGVILCFMLAVVSVSFFISIFVVSRINLIAKTADEIMQTGDLSRRISIGTRWDDLSNLAQILNALLERLESLMQDIREVGNNIAHDLRTPLTRLRNHLEEAQRKNPQDGNAAQLLQEADAILETFNALLRISNIEKGKRHQAFAPVDLPALLQDVVELYEPLAEDENIGLDVNLASAPALQGDRNLLFQLFANLLDNAIKFSPKNETITIALTTGKDLCTVTLRDRGIGIVDGDKEKVFDRFYRTDKSRNLPGNGLGLCLVKAVADLHKGDISLENANPGLRVTVRL